MMQIYCLTVEGGPLNDSLRNLLFVTAQEMMEENKGTRIIGSSVVQGEIKTENEQAVIGGFCGTIFRANLDTKWGSFSVGFVVRPTRKFKSVNMKWGRIPIED